VKIKWEEWGMSRKYNGMKIKIKRRRTMTKGQGTMMKQQGSEAPVSAVMISGSAWQWQATAREAQGIQCPMNGGPK